MQQSLMDEHLRVLTPNWPLQSTVAVNPFWNQVDRPFAEVMTKMSYLTHNALYMPTTYFLEKYRNGEILDKHIELAESDSKKKKMKNSFDLQDFLRLSSEAEKVIAACDCFSDYLDRCKGTTWQTFVTYEIAKYASAFFDEGQALAKFPWRQSSFYKSWFLAQEFDRSFQSAGVEDFYSLISVFRDLTPEMAIDQIISELGFTSSKTAPHYIARLSMINNGWASQFSYHHWRAQLGYPIKENARSIDLIAVQMIVDYTLAKSFEKSNPRISLLWAQLLDASAEKHSSSADAFEINKIWQAALEKSRQDQVALQIKPCAEPDALPEIQVAMCIDVRSETYRRAIETACSKIETIGFAGFFGLPFEYKKIDEKSPGARAPVLLKSGFTVQEEVSDGKSTQIVASALARSYFRNLRKAPMSSFLFVELFSFPALLKMGRDFFNSLRYSKQFEVPTKFSDRKTRPSQSLAALPDKSPMLLEAKVKMAAAILSHMGLKTRFSRLIVLAGHGSHNTNNAFNSASDCGACGGHSGDVNARFLADLLNDTEVRGGLSAHSIAVPDSTYFLAAIHETVTDQLYVLDQTEVPESHKEDLTTLLSAIQKAGVSARSERQLARSECLDSSAWRRARNWSEVRPEWALAGNSCFIVAPRRFTKNANFAGRSFLHDYSWRDDKNFATLELIMTAPMLVTNWINMQYYASTVAPYIYGSGNKVLHNLVNETGVVEGNGGDLRVGLPWQSVHDGTQFVHEPVRLTVFIAAPIEQIEKVIAKHPTVKNLVDNEWLYLIHIDEKSGQTRKRAPDGAYA